MEENIDSRSTGYFDIGQSRIYYETLGDGHPFTLIHDGLVDSRVWDEQYSFFADRYRMIRYDRRGYGRSTRPWEEYANSNDLLSLLQFLQVEKTFLMGVSAGGMIALDFALAFPSLVAALVLVGPAVSGFEFSEHMHRRVETASRPLIEEDDLDQTIENWTNDPYLVSRGNAEARRKLRDYLVTSPHNLYDPHWYPAVEPGEAAIGRLSEVRQPTLILIGEADIPDNHAAAGALHAGIKNSRRVVLSNAGHLPNIEQVDAFNSLVAEFLSGVQPRGSMP